MTEILFRGGDSEDERKFREILAELKSAGCNLLVTGNAPAPIRTEASKKLFGEKGRSRILALTDEQGRDAAAYLPDDTTPDASDTWIINQATGERAAPAVETSCNASISVDTPLGLREDITTALSYYAENCHAVKPGEIRVGVDSLHPLHDNLSQREFRQWIVGVSSQVDDLSAMGHYHFPVSDDSPLVEELTPLFDARIELRQKKDRYIEQRWHLPDHDKRTDWIAL